MPYLSSIHKLQDPTGWNQPWPADAGVTRRLTDHELTQRVHAAFDAALWSNVACDLLSYKQV
jgi:hypothetical protein